MEANLIVSSSPHIRSEESIPRIMWTVVLALAPGGVVGVALFGTPALMVICLAVASAVATEAAIQTLRGGSITTSDGSAFLTGLLLAYVLPPNVPWYVPVVGGVFAIGVAKQAFGGLGNNIWNPALAARAFLQLAYPAKVSLSAWPAPRLDAVTQASPLFKGMGASQYELLDLLLGKVPGCVGETSALALLIGGVFLIYRGYVNWRVPLFYVVTVFVLTWILPDAKNVAQNAPHLVHQPLYHILAGGIFLGAFFMATDMVTSPLSHRGLVVFAIGCGLLTALIRYYTGYPEGVCYSILLMNTATPLIDRYTRPRVYGTQPRGEKQ